MADIWTAVRSIRKQEGHEDASSSLTAVKSTTTNRRLLDSTQEDALVESTAKHGAPSSSSRKETEATITPQTPKELLQALRSQPQLGQIKTILHQLSRDAFAPDFVITIPGALQAQVINTLVTTILHDFWSLFSEQQKHEFVACLTSLAGSNAAINRLKLLSSSSGSRDSLERSIQDLLQVSRRLFSGNHVTLTVWRQLQSSAVTETARRVSWKDYVSLVGSGRIVAVIAQAEDVAGGGDSTCKRSWLADGAQYAAWLGQNIAGMLLKDELETSSSDSTISASSQILIKAMSLGYPSQLLRGLIVPLVEAQVEKPSKSAGVIRLLLLGLPAYTMRTFIEHSMRWLSAFNLHADDKDIPAMASFIDVLTTVQSARTQILSFLSDPVLASSVSLPVRRACLSAITKDASDQAEELLDRLMSIFSDPLFVAHAPILQQEALAQMTLLTAGHVHRRVPMALLLIARSSNHMQGVSNRLDSSNSRARWLGMVVGTAISGLVDKPGAKMSFGTDDMETEEALWYRSLVNVRDHVGTMQDFVAVLAAQETPVRQPRRPKSKPKIEQMPKLNGKQVFGPPRPPAQTKIVGERVTELLDDGPDEDDDLKPHAKPDSDPEDSDEDATLVNRDKAKAPVYIRNLMAMLRDDKSHDRFQLGIQQAATLIRRKTNFGSEVKDHAEELCSILCNLQDPFETESFDELKLQALTAVLLSDVRVIAQWLSTQVFTGDYSISQRCIMLSALGLGGRELAGFKNEDDLNPAMAKIDFASKRLPPHLHKVYDPLASTATKRLEAASKDTERQLINPLALQAADHSTAHLNAVKVRTFSSRTGLERSKRKPAPNQLAQIFGEAFFFPLTNRYHQDVAAYGSASVFASVPLVLVTFLKTLALLLHASGPATVNFPAVATEFWDLLLSLKGQALGDIGVLQAVLFALLTLLESFYDKRQVAEQHPKLLMETQEWVEMIFERMGGGNLVGESGDPGEVKVRTLAAGILVKTAEIQDAYRKAFGGSAFDR